MKKIILLLTTVCICAILLAACTGGEQGQDSSGSGAQNTSAATGAPSIVLPQDELELYVDQTAKITPQLNNIEGRVFWQTTDPYVASVDQEGLVTARSVGTATVSVFNEKAGANITVKVVEPKKTASITFTADSVNVDYYGEYKLSPVIVDCEGPFTWTSSDQSVVKVDNEGNLTPVKVGSADVQINGNGKGAKIRVNVVEGEYLPIVSYERQEILILKDMSLEFGASVAYRGDKVSGFTATYELNDKTVASVDDNGVVTGLKAGATTMTVDINYRGYSFPTITVPVTVRDDVEIRLSSPSVTVYTCDDPAREYYTERQIAVSVFESGREVSNANVTFETEDATVATVSPDGTIKAVATGNTTVRATYTAADGLTAFADISVSVEWTVTRLEAVTTIQVGSSDGSISGETYLPLPDGIGGTITAISGDGGETVKTLVNPGVVLTKELLAAFNRSNEHYVEKGVLTLYSDSGMAYEMTVDAVTLVINNIEDFNKMSDYGKAHETGHTGYYVLNADIDGGTLERLSQYCGGSSYTTNGFRGILDGRGHTISNVRLKTNFLFRAVGENAVIKNFAFLDPIVDEGNIPWFIGELHGATVENVFLRLPTVSMVDYVGSSSHIKNVVLLSTGGTDAKRMNKTLTDNSVVTDCAYIANGFTATSTFGYDGDGKYTIKGCHAYNTTSEMIADLIEENYLSEWTGDFSYENAGVAFAGNRLFGVALDVEYTNEVFANTVTSVSAAQATFALKEAIGGVSIDAVTGELTIGDVSPDTVITVVVTSTVDTAYSKEIDIVVVLRPIDLTDKGVYEMALGAAHGITDIPGDVIAIKTATGTRVTLANANVITASELNAAAGVKWSDNITINFYTENNAYTLNAAFVTKYIHNFEEFKSVASGAATLDGYYVIANSFEANNETPMDSWTAYSSTESTGFIGLLDGRNHVISNLKVNNYILNGIGKSTIRNIAFTNVTAANPSGGGKFLFNESHGMTMKNVFVSSSTAGTMCGFTGNAPNFENVVYVTTNTNASENYGLTWTGNLGTMTLKNVISVTPYSKGYYWGGNVSVANLAVYASQSAMMSALSANTFDGWNSPFAFADGKLTFGGTVVLQ